MRATACAIIFMAASGCFADLGPPTAEQIPPAHSWEVERGCVGAYCALSQEQPTVKEMLKTHGLHMISNRSGTPKLDHELVVWQDELEDGDVAGGTQSNILGFNITSNRLQLIAVARQFHEMRPIISERRVVYLEEANNLAPQGSRAFSLRMWDGRTGERKTLETGLGGEAEPWAFDGQWVVFAQRHGANRSDDGLWALNVDNGTQRRVWGPPTPEETSMFAFAIDGVLFYDLGRPREPGGDVWQAALETGEQRRLFTTGGFVDDLHASGEWLVWGDINLGGHEYVRALNRTLEAFNYIGQRQTMPMEIREYKTDASGARVGGDWIVFNSDAERGLRGYHIPTGSNVHLMGNVSWRVAGHDTDGSKVVAYMFPSPQPADDTTAGIYWFDLPKPPFPTPTECPPTCER